jgi:hypothetical protein
VTRQHQIHKAQVDEHAQRKREREKARYASMSQEEMDEKNLGKSIIRKRQKMHHLLGREVHRKQILTTKHRTDICLYIDTLSLIII